MKFGTAFPTNEFFDCQIFAPWQTIKKTAKQYLPHEIGEVSGRDVALAGSVKSLEGCVGLKGLRLAKILATELDALLALTRVGEQLGKLFLGANRHVLWLHHFALALQLI